MIENYFKTLYQRTMREAYNLASNEIIRSLQDGGECLDCGANTGGWFNNLSNEIALSKKQYYGIEWNQDCVLSAQNKDINITQGNLNQNLPYIDNKFTCIFALSVLEHLLNGCLFLKESHRCLKPGGKLIILTPNISTFFTAALILAGKMPSSGPHPDSNALLKDEELFKVSSQQIISDAESDNPVHRHLVVFSYLVLKKYLNLIGFSKVTGHGFGLYPFPNFSQPILEKIDPIHCHQMVFIAEK